MGREGETVGEKHQYVRDTSTGCLSQALNQGLGLQPGMCPDWEWNRQPFGLQAGAQPTKPHQPWQISFG